MPRIRALRVLEQARNGEIELGHKGWYELTLLATGSKEQAQKAAWTYLMNCHKRGVEPQ